MAGETAAHLFVGGIRREPARVSDGSRIYALGFPELALGAPEAAHAERHFLHSIGERRHHAVAVDEMSLGNRHRPRAPRQRFVGGRYLRGMSEESHRLPVECALDIGNASPAAAAAGSGSCRVATLAETLASAARNG